MSSVLGLQSYTFRKFKDIRALADAMRSLGIKALEVWPGHLCHDDHPSAALEEKVKILADHGVCLSGYGGVALNKDQRQMRKMFSFARDHGIKSLTMVDMKPDCLDDIERLLEEYDLCIAAHNHGSYHWIGTTQRLDELFAKTSNRFGLCLDAAWALHAGIDPIEMARYYKHRLLGVHLKDFVFDAEGKHHDVIIGTGGLKLPAFLQTLCDVGFGGYMSLEYEGDPENPLPSAKACLEAYNSAAAQVR